MNRIVPPPKNLPPPLARRGGLAPAIQARPAGFAKPGPPPPAYSGPAAAAQAKLLPGVVQRMPSSSSSGGGGDLRPLFSEEEMKQAESNVATFMGVYNTLHKAQQTGKAKLILQRIVEMTAPKPPKAYPNRGMPQTPARVGALFCSHPGTPYYVFPTTYGLPWDSYTAQIADGEFCFAILDNRRNEVRVCRDGGGAGHTSLTNGQPVYYAGKVVFAGGMLQRWNNDTGHYRTEKEFKHQAEVVPNDWMLAPLLPTSKFEALY